MFHFSFYISTHDLLCFTPCLHFTAPRVNSDGLTDWLDWCKTEGRKNKNKDKNDYFQYESICWLLSVARDRLWLRALSLTSLRILAFLPEKLLKLLQINLLCSSIDPLVIWFAQYAKNVKMSSFFEQMDDWRLKEELEIWIFLNLNHKLYLSIRAHVASYNFMVLMFIVLYSDLFLFLS